jgi:AraC family transcriptional regulator
LTLFLRHALLASKSFPKTSNAAVWAKTNPIKAFTVFPLQRIEVVEGCQAIPIVPHEPLLSSASLAWDGVLLEEYSVPALLECPVRVNSTVLLHLQTGSPARHDLHSGRRLHRTLIRAGGMHLIPPGQKRSLISHDHTDCLVLSMEPAFLRRSLADLLPDENLELVEKFAFEDIQIERLLKALYAEAKLGAPNGKLFTESLATALAVYLAQQYSAASPKMQIRRAGLPPPRLHRVLNYIGEKLDDNLSLSDLADIAGMNLFYFARLFKQSTGMSPYRYVLDQRIQRAKQLLRNSPITIHEASVRTGFVDQAHFTKVFRRLAGLTPTQYRREVVP